MDDPAIVGASMGPNRSPWVQQALRELAQMAITEACLSGLCDMCLCQADCCNFAGNWREDALQSPRRVE
jgi:hypothetical protein